MRMILMRCDRRSTVAAVAAVAMALTATSCGGGDEAGEDATDGQQLVATTSVWADIVSNVACGEPVASLIPAGADPHSYEPSLRDRAVLDAAALVIANGAGLEATTTDLLDTVAAGGTNVIDLATHVDLLDDHGDENHDGDQDDENHDGDHGDENHDGDQDDENHDGDQDDGAQSDGDDAGHGHGEGDPHFWQDPLRVAGTLDVIASALAAADYRTCADDYRSALVDLDTELTAMLAVVERRVLVTSHDSMEYFADRYDFDVAGTVIPSTSTLASTSAGDLADLADTIEAEGVRAIFTDAFESAGDATALADRLGIEIVPLVTGALTDTAPTYIDMMRRNATLIAEALAA